MEAHAMLLEFDVDIPEDRRLTLQLPLDFPTGLQRIANRLIKLSTDSSSSSEFDIQAIIDAPDKSQFSGSQTSKSSGFSRYFPAQIDFCRARHHCQKSEKTTSYRPDSLESN